MQIIFDQLNILLKRLESESLLDSYRVFHGRGKVWPGLEFVTLDFFDPVLLLTFFHQPPDKWLDNFTQQLIAAINNSRIKALVVQHRYMPGDPSDVIYGELPDQVYARRGDLRFILHLAKQQNTGFLLDIEPARKWLEQIAAGRRILNLFAYTCSFSVVAVAAGAEKVVNLDMSSAALNQGRVNHQLNGLDKSRSQFLAEDILKSWGRIKRAGPYDLVILDPPSFQKGSFHSKKDYSKLVRRLSDLMPSGGLVLSCLNDPDLTPDFLIDTFRTACPNADFLYRLSPHTDFPDIEPDRQLKMLVFSLSE
jgi:23S rRNA (cytosine1962-C5)-methyltransferase